MRQIAFLSGVAQKATEIGYKAIHDTRPLDVQDKNDRDIVTELDVQIERDIRAYLAEQTPEIGFLGEEEGERGSQTGGDWRWILDPIDGTSNFVHGVPLSAVSLALSDGEAIIVAAIALPFLNLQYGAATGLGAFVNGRKLEASKTSELSKAMVSIGDYAVGDNAASRNARRLQVTAKLAENVERVRMFGSAAVDLVWVAEGRLDAAVIMANHPWDTAPGVLIAREAGAVVVDATGAPHTARSTETIAVNPNLAQSLLEVIRDSQS
ncbi:inositol monophosphatase family protein [Crossiella sp. S99.1]|uniref:inositol monophosphatase family protein n=1 Tax=Crossiella sp. S99.1 TaxID=2936271 RepID=UPI001FFFC663|nr:inositol monophosphatase family protein [Crossiella sp. S99.1]MCK2257045.1 inositol monophosphatase [Crossiella sp. S99.1]